MSSRALGRLRAVLATGGRAAVLTLAVIGVTVVATGWLYWLRASVAGWPGPRVRDTLALDELPGHDSVPLVVYVLVFALAGLILGLVARAARLDRLAAGLGLASAWAAGLSSPTRPACFSSGRTPWAPRSVPRQGFSRCTWPRCSPGRAGHCSAGQSQAGARAGC